MRTFLVTFKAGGKGIDTTGDAVSEVPDGALFDLPFVNRLKADIKAGIEANLAESWVSSGPGDQLPTVSQVFLLAVIPLESARDAGQDAQEAARMRPFPQPAP